MASTDFVGGFLDASYGKKTSWGSIGAFASGRFGMKKASDGWERAASAIGGLRVTF